MRREPDHRISSFNCSVWFHLPLSFEAITAMLIYGLLEEKTGIFDNKFLDLMRP